MRPMEMMKSLNEEIDLALQLGSGGLENNAQRIKDHVKNFLANKIGMLTPENEEFWYRLYPEDRR